MTVKNNKIITVICFGTADRSKNTVSNFYKVSSRIKMKMPRKRRRSAGLQCLPKWRAKKRSTNTQAPAATSGQTPIIPIPTTRATASTGDTAPDAPPNSTTEAPSPNAPLNNTTEALPNAPANALVNTTLEAPPNQQPDAPQAPLPPSNVEDFLDLDDNENNQGKPLFPFKKEQMLRLTIGYIFDLLFDGKEDCEEQKWKHQGGVIPQIKKLLNIPSGSRIDYILEEVIQCKKKGLTFFGDSEERLGRTATINLNSEEAQIIADGMETGCGQQNTWHLVNAFRKQKELPSLTFCTVRTALLCMKAKVVKIKKVQQGSNDATKKNCRARCKFARQLAIQLGLLDYQPEDGGVTPAYYDKDKLNLLTITQIGHWDESHFKSTPGTDDDDSIAIDCCLDYYLEFPRDANGKYDPNGEYSDKQKTIKQCKYVGESRFSF